MDRSTTRLYLYGLMLAITVLSLAAACQVKFLVAFLIIIESLVIVLLTLIDSQKREAKPVETPAKLGSTNEKGEKK